MTSSEPRLARLRRELRATGLLALPLALGQLSAVAMNVVDTWLAGQHGALTLASVAVGSQVWSLVILILIGVLMALPAFVSQLNGAGRRHDIGRLFRQVVWLGLGLGIGLMLLVRQSGWLLRTVGIAEEVQPGAEAFLLAVSWGAPGLALFFVFRGLSDGIAWTVPTMLFGLAGLALLLPLGWALMFGRLGLPGLGAAGLGYATAIVLWLQALGFLVYLAISPRFADLCLFEAFELPRWAPIAEVLRVGLPMGVSIFMEGSLFVATGLIIGTLGAVEVAAHQIALIIASATFMIPFGVALATTVRVGHAAGAGDRSGLRWAGASGYVWVGITQTAAASLLVLGAGLIAALFTTDPTVRALAASLMLFAAAFQYVDGIQALSAGALRGLKDTRVPMFITAFSYWGVGMPLGWVLGIAMGMGPQGLWIGLIGGLSSAALLLTLRFRRMASRSRDSGLGASS
jgi:multidrug resistance protein, MATE family